MRKRVRILLLSLLGLFWASPVSGAVLEDFEGPDPSWQVFDSDLRYRVDLHQRVTAPVHTGRYAEQIRVRADNGSRLYFAQPVGPAHVIDELRVTLWMKADRPGIQLLARAVLPRSAGRDGKPLTAIIPGSAYKLVGSWQQLTVDNIPQLVERQHRVLRAQVGPNVDARGAYIDRAILNVYGGPGATSVSIDDLELAGAVDVRAASAVERLPAVAANVTADWRSITGAGLSPDPSARLDLATFNGTNLTIAGKPFFPRMVEYRGEDLRYLALLGFNAIKLDTSAGSEILGQARAAGLRVVVRPPTADQLQSRGLAAIADPQALDVVLAWTMGEGLSARELDATKQWSKLLRNLDGQNHPLVCDAECDLRTFSRQVDILLPGRRPLGTSMELAEYATWLRSRMLLARLGTPFWAAVQTEPARSLIEQIELLSGAKDLAPRIQHEQIRQLAFAAIAAGARGLSFDSDQRLDSGRKEDVRRSAILELVNLELELIEPWCAAGTFVTSAASNSPDTAGAILQTEHARLLLPLCVVKRSQFAINRGSGTAVSFIIPGVPESNKAFKLTPVGLQPLPTSREAGGIRLSLTTAEADCLVLLTQDDVVVQSLARSTEKMRKRAAELQLILARDEVEFVEAVQRQLPSAKGTASAATKLLAGARLSTQEAAAHFGRGDVAKAFDSARGASVQLDRFQRGTWEEALAHVPTPMVSALAASFATLPLHMRLGLGVKQLQGGRSELVGGDFEDLGLMLRAGWRHFEHPQQGIATAVDLAPGARSGSLCLHLRTSAARSNQPSPFVETPPLWVTSGGVRTTRGELVEIKGWVRVPREVRGSIDGLQIVDSLGGEALAERITVAPAWQEFRLYRACPRDGLATVTFALTGLGEAWIDDVSIRRVAREDLIR